MKIIIVFFLCSTALNRTVKCEEEECNIYEKESPNIKNRYVKELAGTFFAALKDEPYLKLNQTVLDSIRGGISLGIVYDDGDTKSIVNLIHLKDKNKDVDESDSESYEEYGLF